MHCLALPQRQEDLGDGLNHGNDVGLNIANSKARAALLSLSDDPRATRIDLIEWKQPPTVGESCPELYHTGFGRIALFTKPDPTGGEGFADDLNPNSLEVLTDAKLEPGLANPAPGSRYQFERLGYFCVDPDTKPGAPVFNRTVALKDTWAKVAKRSQPK